MKQIEFKINQKSSNAEKEIKFFKENDNCPTCEQHIDEEFKKKAIEQRTDKMVVNACSLVRVGEQLSEMDARMTLYEAIEKDVRNNEVDAAKKTTSLNAVRAFNEQLTEQIDEINNADTQIEATRYGCRNTVMMQSLLRKRRRRLVKKPTTSISHGSCFRTPVLRRR